MNHQNSKNITLLLLMTTGMSLKKWDELGQLSRGLNIYQRLGEKIGQVYIYSYGKKEENYVKEHPIHMVVSIYQISASIYFGA
jgi:hypothetical protein